MNAYTSGVVVSRSGTTGMPGRSADAVAAVTFSGVGVGYGAEEVLRDLSFEVQTGEFVCVLGPSGCGKSTTLRMMGGLLTQTSGDVTVAGGSPKVEWRRLAFVFQSPRLVPWRSALGNVLLGMQLRGCGGSRDERRTAALRYLEMVGLGQDAHKPSTALSGGERQRVAIARALAVDPDIVLMDEPLSALDVATKLRLRREIVDLWQATGKTIVFVTHDLDEALYLADRLVVLSGKPASMACEHVITAPRPRTIDDDAELAEIKREVHGIFVGEEGRT